jgi:hypothetical protein
VLQEFIQKISPSKQTLNESAGNEALASIVESADNEDGAPRTHHKSQFKIEL